MKFYISTSLSNRVAADLMAQLLYDAGHTNTLYWWSVKEPEDDMDKIILSQREINAVKDADAVIFIPPGGRGCHMELGIAIGLGKPVLALLPQPEKPAMFYSLFKWIQPEQAKQFLDKQEKSRGLRPYSRLRAGY